MPYSKLQGEAAVQWQKIEEGVGMLRETEMFEQHLCEIYASWEGSEDISLL